jgi:hypothetical protein
LSRWYIKTAIVYLVAALVVGVALAARPAVGLPSFVASLGPAYLHLLSVGWITQMIFGVAYWMFPRLSRERPRGSGSAALATYLMLNCGLVLRALAEPADTLGGGAVWDWLLTLSATLQWGAGLIFALNIWGRVKEK